MKPKSWSILRDHVPFPDETTPLQKVINPTYIDSYPDGSFANFNDGKISGCIATAEDVTGLTASTNGQVVPEFYSEGLSLNNGAQMIEITDAGEEILETVYDEDLQRFVLVD